MPNYDRGKITDLRAINLCKIWNSGTHTALYEFVKYEQYNDENYITYLLELSKFKPCTVTSLIELEKLRNYFTRKHEEYLICQTMQNNTE
jgi:hypothetical protein